MMSGFGIPQEAIASFLICDLKTLRKFYRYELDNGATEANTRVVHALYMNATKHNNVAAQIWWTKGRMGWYAPHPPDEQKDNADLVVDFRWADPPPPQAITNGSGPVIDAAAEDDSEPEVVWQNGSKPNTDV